MSQDKQHVIDGAENVPRGFPEQKSALPGTGGLARIASAAANSIRGLREGVRSEAAIKQEIVLFIFGVPLASVIATGVWVWVAMVASLLVVLLTEFLNTAVERLCNHVTPQRHEAIRVTKDMASAGVFFALALAALVWGVALLDRFAFVG
jgi:diacylglycerol kinase (ATP)